MTRSSWRFAWQFGALWLLLLGAFALRLYRLDAVSLRGDESFTVLFVLKPFGQMWNEILTVEPNPPLLYLALRDWVGVAGAGEFATRYFSVFWGVLCVALLYRLTVEFFRLSNAPRRTVALAATLLIAVNPYQVWHSQDVRNYTMWPALSLLALIFFWQWRNAHKAGAGVRARAIFPFVLAELAALYTHYYEVFVLVALNLYVLVFLARRWPDLRRRGLFSLQSPVIQWVGAQLALAALYLPFPLLLSNRVSSYGEGSGKQGLMLWDIWQRTMSVFMVGETLDETIRSVVWIPLALALVLCLWLLWRRERRGIFIILWAGIPTLAIFGLNLFRPLFLERYLNGIAPVYYLLAAYGLVVAWNTRWKYVAVLALTALLAVSALALGNYFYNPAFAKAPDWRGIAQAIHAGRQDGDIILQNFPETSLLYYEGGHLPLVVYPEEFLPGKTTVPALEKLNGKYRRVWFLPAAQDFWDPNHAVENYLDAHDELLSEQNIGTMRLELYSTPAQFTQTMRPANAQVGNFFTLAGYRVARQESGWHLVLYWQVRKTPPVNMSVFIQFVDSKSVPPRIVSSLERPPLNGALPTGAWRAGELIVDSYDLPADGAATALRVGMYNPTNSKRLPVTAPNLPAADYYEISP